MDNNENPPPWRAPGLHDMPLGLNPTPKTFQSEEIEHSVWDEPALAGMATDPHDDFNYAAWIRERQASTSEIKSWIFVLAIALLSCPWGAMTWFVYLGNFGWGDVVTQLIFAPLMQEISKIALLLWVIEKRPYWIKGWFQIFICCLASASFFVVLFNWMGWLMGTHPFGLWFQWTAFFLMQLVASTVAAIGLEKVWHPTAYKHSPPVLEAGFNWFRAAFLINALFSAATMFAFRLTGLFEWLNNEVQW